VRSIAITGDLLEAPPVTGIQEESDGPGHSSRPSESSSLVNLLFGSVL